VSVLDLLSHNDTVINLRMNCVIISVIYDIVYFAVPGQVENLTLIPGPYDVNVTWMKPILNSYCVTQYVIDWVHTEIGSNSTKNVSSDDNSVLIEDLDACVEYEVSVRAMNEENESTDAVTGNTRTEIVGNYHAQIILLY